MEEDDEILLGHYRAVIKGVQYYQGVAHVGEYVTLRREPTNNYDKNAIEVLNLNNSRIGHIAKETAAALASVMDRKMIKIEATIPRPSGTYEQALTLTFYSSPQNVGPVREHFTRTRLTLLASLSAPPPTPAPAYSSAAAAYSAYASAPAVVPVRAQPVVPTAKAAPKTVVLANKITVAPGAKSSQQSLEQILDTITGKKFAPIDQAATCGAILTSTLFGHQLEGVAFLLAREKDTSLPPFWSRIQEKGQSGFINSITNSFQNTSPQLVKGGVLADDMGLGKTLQLLALVVAHPPAGIPAIVPGGLRAANQRVREAMSDNGYDTMSSLELQQACRKMKINQQGSKAELVEKIMVTLLENEGEEKEKEARASGAPPKTTLIVCPVSVIGGWMDQVRAHISPNSLKLYNYSGAGRLADTDFLSSQDIIFVSYSTLAIENSRGPPEVVGNKRARESQGLFHMPFWRIILDESHTIRNRNTQMFKACMRLNSTNRWCVTGTPIQNRADDAFPLFAFLRAAPCDEWATFNRAGNPHFCRLPCF